MTFPISLVVIIVLGVIYRWYINSDNRTYSRIEQTELLDKSQLQEASFELDIEDLDKFFHDLTIESLPLSDHITRKIISTSKSLLHDKTASFEFYLSYEGKNYPLFVELFKDDVSSIAIYFFSEEVIASNIETFYEQYCEVNGN
ncbi:MAG: hypothetical protein HQL32_09530 [Planctomycetes bacterium]|nr:hypothetical protein [Planctomycetota bacterium]